MWEAFLNSAFAWLWGSTFVSVWLMTACESIFGLDPNIGQKLPKSLLYHFRCNWDTFCNSLCHLPPPCICWSLSVVSILYIDSLINFPGKCEPKKVLDTNFELNQCETQKKLSLIEENKSFGSNYQGLGQFLPVLTNQLYDCSSYFKLSYII